MVVTIRYCNTLCMSVISNKISKISNFKIFDESNYSSVLGSKDDICAQ